MFIKGYSVDYNKISRELGVDINDRKVDIIARKVLEQVDREVHWIGLARAEEGGPLLNIISFGKGCCSANRKELEATELAPPEYLKKMEFVLSGPEVFELESWSKPRSTNRAQ